jgi:hypothetical protein
VVGEVLKRDKRTEYTLDTDAMVMKSEKEEAKWTYKNIRKRKAISHFWVFFSSWA